MSDWDGINEEIDQTENPSFWDSTKDWGSDFFNSFGQDVQDAASYGLKKTVTNYFDNQKDITSPDASDKNIITDLFGRIVTNISDQSNRMGLLASNALPSVINVDQPPGSTSGGINTNILLYGGIVIIGVIVYLRFSK